jgi:hypothetical protein
VLSDGHFVAYSLAAAIFQVCSPLTRAALPAAATFLACSTVKATAPALASPVCTLRAGAQEAAWPLLSLVSFFLGLVRRDCPWRFFSSIKMTPGRGLALPVARSA